MSQAQVYGKLVIILTFCQKPGHGIRRQRRCFSEDLQLPKERNLYQRKEDLVHFHLDCQRSQSPP